MHQLIGCPAFGSPLQSCANGQDELRCDDMQAAFTGVTGLDAKLMPLILQRMAKELEQLEALQQVRQTAADSAELMAPVARRKVRKEIEKVTYWLILTDRHALSILHAWQNIWKGCLHSTREA